MAPSASAAPAAGPPWGVLPALDDAPALQAWAQALSDRWLADGPAPPTPDASGLPDLPGLSAVPGAPGQPAGGPPAAEGHAVALAAALQRHTLAAWGSDPPRALRAVAWLRALHARWPQPPELAARLAWAEAIADFVQGRMADGAQRLDQASAALQALGQPLEAARAQVPKVMALAMQGRLDEAAASGQATQQALLALGDGLAAAKVSLNLGSLAYRRDDHAAATRHYRAAALLFARQRDTPHSVMADIGLGHALSLGGDLAEARRIHARAGLRAQHHGLALMAAMADESTALLDLATGAYGQALAGLERARRAYQQLGLPQQLAIAEKQLADAYLALRLWPEALAVYDQALATMQALDMPDDQAWTLLAQGRVLAGLGRRPEAVAALARAATQFQRQGVPGGSAAVALVQAELALQQGDAEAARTLARQAHAAYDQAGQPEGAAHALATAAAAKLQAGRVAEARQVFAQALDRARALQLLNLQVRCQTGLGQAALAQQDEAAAEAVFTAAVAQCELQWQMLPGDELRNAFQADHLAPYQGLLALALRQAQAAEAATGTVPAAQVGQVLQRLDDWRARALSARLQAAGQGVGPGAGVGKDGGAVGGAVEGTDGGAGVGGPAPGVVATDPALEDRRARVHWLAHRVQQQTQEGGASATLTAALREAEADLMEQARRVRLAAAQALAAAPSGAGAAADAAHPPAERPGLDDQATGALDLDALQARLGPQDAVVVFGRDGPRLLAAVLRHPAAGGGGQAGRHLRPALADWAQVQQAWDAARFQLDALRHGAVPRPEHLPLLLRRAQARLQALHALLWAPLVPWLPAQGRVLVVPPAGLWGLPFAALHDGQAWLAERHALAQAPSLRVAAWALQRPPVPARRVLALGERSRLPHAGDEVQAVAALFGPGGGQACLDEQATWPRLRALAPEADVLHLACHAEFRDDNPLFSALHLHDGPLTAERAEALALRAGTVVLSACETGLAGGAGRDEQMGLVRAFLVAGAARVLASLWPVDDACTARFMAAFYPALRDGQSPAQALQTARQALAQGFPHPVFWAGFVLYGAW